MKRQRNAIGYRIGVCKTSYGSDRYRHFNLQIYGGSILDAADKYRQTGSDYDLDFLKTVRERNKGCSWEEKDRSTLYFYESSNERFELRWQSHRDYDYCNGDWKIPYAMRVDSAEYNQDTIKLMDRLLKAICKINDNYDTTPEQAIRAIHSLGGCRIVYGDSLYRWYLNPMSEDEISDIHWSDLDEGDRPKIVDAVAV